MSPSRILSLLLPLLLILPACTGVGDLTLAGTPTTVSFSAAFTGLDHIEVFSLDGEFITELNRSQEFQLTLPEGDRFLLDFVDELGQHAFLPDGRMTFSPTLTGAALIQGPVFLEGLDHPLWEILVHSDLEANHRMNARLRRGDLLDSEEGLLHSRLQATGGPVRFESALRARLVWETEFAMRGSFEELPSATCIDGEPTSSASTSFYACPQGARTRPDWVGGGTYWGYIDFDPLAWGLVYRAYDNGDLSCVDSMYEADTYGPCYVDLASLPDDPATPLPEQDMAYKNPSTYTCDGDPFTAYGPWIRPHGGQCKAFTNLLAYRAGFYNSSLEDHPRDLLSWRNLPYDGDLNSSSYRATHSIVVSSPSTTQAGDMLRRSSGSLHSTIVVYWDDTTATARVVDSNLVGGGNHEHIGSHIMGFSPAYSGVNNLGIYYNLTCIYHEEPCGAELVF